MRLRGRWPLQSSRTRSLSARRERLTRYDCKAGGRANVESTLYRGAMASGEVTEVYHTPDVEIRFEWVNPQAPGGESMRRVCGALGTRH